MSTPVPGVLSRRSHRRWARIRCAPPFARNEQPQLSCRQSQEPHLHAEQDAPDHGHGRDQAVPGPADSVSRAVLMTSRPAPGQALFPHLTGAEQNASYAGTAVEFTVKYGNASLAGGGLAMRRRPWCAPRRATRVATRQACCGSARRAWESGRRSCTSAPIRRAPLRHGERLGAPRSSAAGGHFVRRCCGRPSTT